MGAKRLTQAEATSGILQHPSRRSESVDFWRGVVLCTIFVNHIPGNLFEILTQKNYGFSDSAEAFVFLSGFSLALAYASRFRTGQGRTAIGAIALRAVRLYGVHIALSLAAIAIFAVGAAAMGSDAILGEHGRDLFVEDPRSALVGLFSLGHQLGYFNILPLYILLLAPASVLLWIGCMSPAAMLTGSFGIYVAARVYSWNIPTWPMKGTWFFDPFAWQFMMGLGLCAGLVLRRQSLPLRWWLIGPALAIVTAGLASVTNGFGMMPGLEDWTAGWADLDKTVLGAGRIVHFVAVAYLIAAIDLAGLLRRWIPVAPFCRLGRNSLWMFALLSLLAAVGQVLVEAFGHSPELDIVMIGGGLSCLYGAATLLETRRLVVSGAALLTRP